MNALFPEFSTIPHEGTLMPTEVKTSTAIASIPPEAVNLAKNASVTLELMTSTVISTPEAFLAANDQLKMVKTQSREMDAARLAATADYRAAVDEINEFFKQPLNFLIRAEAVIKKEMTRYKIEEDARVAEAARIRQKAIDDARLKAEKEERERLADQAARDAVAKAAADVIAEASRKAEEAMDAGDDAGAEIHIAALKAAVAAAPIPVQPTVPAVVAPAPMIPAEIIRTKAAGVAFRKDWKVRVIDPAALPPEYTLPNLALLGKLATDKKELAECPGCEFYYDNVLISGRG